MYSMTESKILAELSRGGDQEAARKIVDRYLDRLVALAQRRLSPKVARRVDPEDIVQSVFRTFFTRLQAGQFQIAEQDDLCKLLMRITVYKTLRQVHHHQAAKRDPRQETGSGHEKQEQLQDLLDREPDPETAVIFVDQLETFLGKLGSEERKILEMRLQGYSNEEIAKELKIYDRKIRRVIERVRGMAEVEGLGQ